MSDRVSIPGRTVYAERREGTGSSTSTSTSTSTLKRVVTVRRACPYCKVGRVVVVVDLKEGRTEARHEGRYLCAGAARALSRGGRDALVELLGGEEIAEKVGLVAGILGR